MTLAKELIAKFEGTQPIKDRRDFSENLGGIFHVGIYLDASCSEEKQCCKFFLRPLPGRTYAKEKWMEMAEAEVRRWLEKRNSPKAIELFDGSGAKLRTVTNKPTMNRS